MKLLLKTLLIRRARDEGFVLPVAVALGLIMALLGTFSIVQSSEENLSATVQNEKSKSLAAAEAGVSRYLNLIARNRPIALYDNADWSSWDSTPTPAGVPTNGLCNIYSEISDAIDGWEDVVSSTGTYDDLGQYRLISYQYLDNTNAVVPSGTTPTDLTKGRLIVEGRASSGDTSATRVQVDIPVRREQPDLSNFDPALWIGSPQVTNIGGNNLKVGDNNGGLRNLDPADGDTYNTIVFSDPAGGAEECNIPTVSNQPSSDNTTQVIYQAYSLPDTPAEPTKYILITSTQLNNALAAGASLPYRFTSPNISSAEDSSGYFHYIINGNLTIDNTLSVTTGAKVILYVCGDITIDNSGGTLNINQGGNTSEFLEIYGNYVDSGVVTRFNTVCGATTTQNITLQGSGTTNITAFIHAPDAEVKTNSDPTVNFTGAIWVDDWNDTSTNSDIIITPDSYESYSSRQTMVIPSIGAPTDWQIVDTN
ncbi:DUF7305 domain-containing protein [Myxosarcina sp. GI1(2024)]